RNNYKYYLIINYNAIIYIYKANQDLAMSLPKNDVIQEQLFELVSIESLSIPIVLLVCEGLMRSDVVYLDGIGDFLICNS
ncbi:hypothetical protein DOY81_014309, partial [Sarcophaga bullata]